jgi:hypothetical protein
LNLVLDVHVVHDLVHVAAHHYLLGFSETVVKGMVVNLVQSCLVAVLGGCGIRLDHLDKVLDGFLRVINHVSFSIYALSSFLELFLDLGVKTVVFVVNVGEFDDSDAGAVLILVEIAQKLNDFVKHEQELLFILEADEVLNVFM